MTCPYSSITSKKLLMQYIKENAEYRKRCQYLQEIIQIGRMQDVWRKALVAYFDTSISAVTSAKAFSKN